jgi:HEAT repeat protein
MPPRFAPWLLFAAAWPGATGTAPKARAAAPPPRAEIVAFALRSQNDEERARAAGEVLGAGRGALPALVAALSDPDYRVRRRACQLLLRLGDERAIPPLLDLVYADDPATDVRVAAAWAAYRLGQSPMLEKVQAELASPWWHRRLNAVADLAVLGDAGAGPLFAGALSDPAWLVRLRAVRALRAVDPRPWARDLLALADDEESVVRYEVLEALVGLGPTSLVAPEEVAGALALALQDEDEAVRHLAAREIVSRPDAGKRLSAFPELSARHDRSPRVRAELLEALARDPAVGVGELRRFLRDPAWRVRVNATAALRARGERGLLGRLVADLATARPEEVADAAPALSRFGPDGVIAQMERAVPAILVETAERLAAQGAAWREALARRALAGLSDPAPHRRAAAAGLVRALLSALNAASRAQAASALRAAAAEGMPAARAALASLAERGLPEKELEALAQSASGWVRALALRSMAHHPRAGSFAARSLADRDPRVRAAAVVTLEATVPPTEGERTASLAAAAGMRSARGSPAVAAALENALSDPDATVREAAARALWRLGDTRGLSTLREALEKELERGNPMARREAARELARIAQGGDEAATRALTRWLADADPLVRAAARTTSTRALEEAARGTGLTALVATHTLAEAGHPRGAPLRALVEVGRADLERLGETQPRRLAALLAARLPKEIQGPTLLVYLERFAAPALLSRLTDDLARELLTRWRGTPPYNMRRQNLYNREIGEAVRELPGLHPPVLKAMLYQESNLEPLAGNRFDCTGLAAFCRSAAEEEGLRLSERFRDFAADERYSPRAAILAAVRHLKRKAELLEEGAFRRYGTPRGKDYWSFALAAYNGGHLQVESAMKKAYEAGRELAKARGLRRLEAVRFARAHAARWDNLLAPEEEPEDSPLHGMTQERYPWYRPYGRYRKMKGAEAKYHEIGQFPIDVLERAAEGP